jgi:hypothetical protein
VNQCWSVFKKLKFLPKKQWTVLLDKNLRQVGLFYWRDEKYIFKYIGKKVFLIIDDSK